MRLFRSVFVLLLLAVWAVPAFAQSAPAAAPGGPGLVPPAGASGLFPAVPSPEPEDRWSADFLLGLPTGVRVQRLLGGDRTAGWQAEGFVGLEVIFPMAGAGVRA